MSGVKGGPVAVIHAGAGGAGGTAARNPDACRAALIESLAAARAVLERDGDAVSAVQAAVVVMEDFELFNAGRGAVLCVDGSVELSAAIMRSDRSAGAVAAVKEARNPILAAGAVMDSRQVLMVGPAADSFAASAGVDQVDPSHFVTEYQRSRLREVSVGADHATVGAVCLDCDGLLAAGTSTGGIRAQLPGRVGDCPQIGAGTWADERVAVSCTGDGEAFIRSGASRYIAALVEHGVGLEEAARRALDMVEAVGGEGGLIAVDVAGEAAMPFLTATMPRGIWRAGSDPEAWVIESP